VFTSTYARLGLVSVAAALCLAAAAAPAGAQPSGPATTEPSAPPGSTPPSGEPPPASSPPASSPPSSSPPSSNEPKRLSVLEVSATFDKPAYRTGETMTIRFRVGNELGVRIDRLRVHQTETPDAIQTDYGSWGELNNETGVTIEDGGDRTFVVTGRVSNPEVETAVLAGTLYQAYPGTNPLTQFSYRVPMNPTFGHAAGIVYDDRNHNGRYNRGEPGLPGARVQAINSLYPEDEYTAVTGADGAFTFPRLPTVSFEASVTAPGWQVTGQQFTVGETGADSLRLAAVRSLDKLAADVKFGKDVYRSGDRVAVKVTLTNSGSRPVSGIVANCADYGGISLSGTGPGWGALAGRGVTVGAKQTRVLTVRENLPYRAVAQGMVEVACSFGYRPQYYGGPWADDRARVTGAFGNLVIDVDGVPGVRVVAVTAAHCPIVGDATSNAKGRIRFQNLPAGEYRLYVYPPGNQDSVYGNPAYAVVVGNTTQKLVLELGQRVFPLPGLPKQPAGCTKVAPVKTPAPQGKADTGGLAYTGASVLTIGVIGLVVLVVGTASVVATRRRRT
jgi:hypothetical protein